MSLERGFVPLPEAITDNIRFAAKLPEFVNQDEIGVNTGRIERAMKLGRIEHLRVETFDEDQGVSELTIVGYDTQGNAFAGQTKAKSAELFETEQVKNGYKSDLVVRLNISEMTQRFEELRNPQNWSREIDKSVKKAISQTGNRKLLTDDIDIDGFSAIIVGSVITIGNLMGDAELQLSDYRLLYLGNLIASNLSRFINRRGELSLCVGPKLDTMMRLKIASIKPFVKGFEQKG